MKVFRIWSDRYGWDDFDSCIVVAESEEAVHAMMYKRNDMTIIGDDEEVYFLDRQGELHIEEIDLSVTGIISSSFNAG